MLTLDLPIEPYWLDLPRGVRVEIRPVTTAVMAAAQAGSARRLGALRAAEADLDPDMARGLAFAFLVKALARHAVTAWEGVGDTAGRRCRSRPRPSSGSWIWTIWQPPSGIAPPGRSPPWRWRETAKGPGRMAFRPGP